MCLKEKHHIRRSLQKESLHLVISLFLICSYTSLAFSRVGLQVVCKLTQSRSDTAGTIVVHCCLYVRKLYTQIYIEREIDNVYF